MITLEEIRISNAKDIVEALNFGGQGYVAITNNGKLVGLVTDGDIRRCLLNDNLNVEGLVNRKPRTCRNTETKEFVKQQLGKYHLKQMLIVDDLNNLVDVFCLDENLFEQHDNKVVIMAGGLGSRLGELTKTTPKPMLNVAGKPIILHIIERFRGHGFRDFIISTNYKKEVIEDFLQDGQKFGVNIEYVNEGKRLGTAGALSLIKHKLNEPFIVTNADVISMVNYPDLLSMHLDNNCSATMCVRDYEYTVPFGVIEIDKLGNIEGIKEKPKCTYSINAGIYVLNPSVVDHIPQDTFYDMPSLFLEINSCGEKTMAYQLNDYWIDIGNPDDYQLANEEVAGCK